MMWMEHPALGPDRKQEVTEKAFDTAWSRSGWVKCDPPPPPPSPSEAKTSFEVLFEDSQELEDSDYDDESEEQEE